MTVMRAFYFVADSFPAWRVDLVELFAVQLRALGVETTWQTRRSDAGWMKCVPMHEQIALLPLSVGRKNFVAKALNRPLELLSELLIFARLLFGPRYDFIQVRDDRYSAALFALLAAKLRRVPFTYWLSFPFPEHDLDMATTATGLRRTFLQARGRIARWWLYRLVLPAADHVFVQSQKMRDNFAAAGLSIDKMTPVPMGIPPSLLDRAVGRQKCTIPGQIIYLGTLAASRHLEILVEAFSLVRRRHPEATLLMVGEGDFPHERRELEQLAVQLGVADAVRFTGFLPMGDAWQLVMSSAVCVSPFAPSTTLDVASPTKLIEYLALAKPTVANQHPEQTQVLAESRAGILVEWGAQPFADGISRLLDDPGTGEEMASRGPHWVRSNRTYDRIAAGVFACYRRLQAKRTPANIVFKGEQ